MKPELKKALQEAYEAPEAKHKKEFLRKIEKPQMNTYSFMLQQVSYIRKRVWLLSIAVCVIALAGIGYVGENAIWMSASMMPFIALCAVTENARSVTFGMAELEMASRFSLKSIVLARAGIIGALHFVVFAILVPFIGKSSFIPFTRTGFYLLVPYLLSSVLGLFAVRKFKEIDATYLCMVTSAIVCVLNIALKSVIPEFYGERKFVWWVLVTIYLMYQTWKEYSQSISQTEELV